MVQLDKIKLLDTGMQGSTVYAQKATKQPPRKKARSSELVESEEVLSTTLVNKEAVDGCKDTSREKVWLDDLVSAITSVLQDFAEGDEVPCSEPVQFAIKYVVSLSFTFCFTKGALVNGKPHTKWSELRSELRRVLYSALRQACSSSSAVDSAKMLLDAVGSLPTAPVTNGLFRTDPLHDPNHKCQTGEPAEGTMGRGVAGPPK